MKKKPLFTIITVVFNGESSIRDTIKSVINQNFNDFEYIVWDGLSTDKTLDVINKYKSKINIIKSTKDSGIYDAMNRAVKISSGRYILFLNSGDKLYSTNVLSMLHNKLNSNIDFNIIYGDVVLDDSTYIKSKKFESIIYGMPFCHQSVFVHYSLFETNSFNTNFKVCSDYDFFLKIYRLLKIKYLKVDFPVSIFEVGGLSYKLNIYLEYFNIIKQYYTIFNYVYYFHFSKSVYSQLKIKTKRFL